MGVLEEVLDVVLSLSLHLLELLIVDQIVDVGYRLVSILSVIVLFSFVRGFGFDNRGLLLNHLGFLDHLPSLMVIVIV